MFNSLCHSSGEKATFQSPYSAQWGKGGPAVILFNPKSPPGYTANKLDNILNHTVQRLVLSKGALS